MVVDEVTQAVRRQLELGRLLPLGEPVDGLWLAERAAARVLREAAATVTGLQLRTMRLSLADPESAAEPAVPPPPSALPPGPLRIDASCAATAEQPLPAAAARLRAALASAADQRLGLTLAAIDLRVTDLLDTEPASPDSGSPEEVRRPERAGNDAPEGRRVTDGAATHGSSVFSGGRAQEGHPVEAAERTAAAAATGVAGVTRLDPVMGAVGRAVHVTDTRRPPTPGRTDGGAMAGHHVRVQLAVAADQRTVDTARAVRDQVAAAVAAETTAAVTVAVVVTAIERG